ncbi:hypothetical protein BMF94_6762 [Rhodotorula taiwanensis]|uniref:HORMA domain-containing protein n=1 Tax=Rhodotorula taiwanensis TaxID=741276 RepID=A0A2S5B077_9BASI|nr:hypothetical protein BMF94_6762 [Rhodotorula taiwanensis]
MCRRCSSRAAEMAQRMRPTEQKVEERVVTVQSSLQQVKELVETGIGCIAYLRGLLPEDAFADNKLAALRTTSLRSKSAAEVGAQSKVQPGPDDYTYVRVKKIKRGATTEGDKLLDYLELGAAEAIEKGYLHKLVFAIYLDPDEPTNIVESYTFTFTYETDSEGNKHPDMFVADQFSSMALSAATFDLQPRNKPRKIGDIKRQIQQMIKNLITNTQILEELPKRRFLNFRLFYTDDTPAEYEPPCFFPVPLDAPGYSLTTPSVSDVPEFCTLGSLVTGYHGVALHTVSITDHLDVKYDETISPEEALARNKRDAETRPVVWDGEALAQAVTDEDAKVVEAVPLGVHDVSGRFLPLQEVVNGDTEEMERERKRAGIEPNPEAVFVPQGRLEETIVDSHMSDNEALRRAIAATEKRPASNSMPATQVEPVVSRVRSYQPPVPFFDETQAQYQERLRANSNANAEAGPSRIRAEEKIVAGERAAGPEAEEAQPETQLIDYSQLSLQADQVAQEPLIETGPEPIAGPSTDSRSKQHPRDSKAVSEKHPKHDKHDKPPLPSRRSSRNRATFTADACECGDKEDDGGMICCSTCEVWKHAVCYGYEDAKDSRIPDIFVCYHCRAQQGLSDLSIERDREAEIGQALAELRSLALFRRAIDAVWHNGVLSIKDLAKYLAVDNSTAGQVLKRLKSESFIVEQSASRKSKGKGGTQVGSLKAPAQAVNKTSKQVKRKKLDYFSPGGGAEAKLISLLEPNNKRTQEEDVEMTDVLSVPAKPAMGAAGTAAPPMKSDNASHRQSTVPDSIVDEDTSQESAVASPAVIRNADADKFIADATKKGEQGGIVVIQPDDDADEGVAALEGPDAPKRRASMAELDANVPRSSQDSGQLPRRKRQKCSEANEVEV